jgi:hypothetical protein
MDKNNIANIDKNNIVTDLNKINIVSIFILSIIVFSNYSVNILPCRLKSILINYNLSTHVILFFILLFTIFLNNYEGYKSLTKILLNSVLVYGWFVLIVNLNIYCLIIILLLLFLLLIVNKLIDYEVQHMKIKQGDKLYKIKETIEKTVLYLTIIGTIYSYITGDLEINHIIYGIRNCNSI